MNFEKIAKSVFFFEFLNKIDNLTHELLYAEKDGFYCLKNRDAIENAEIYLARFEDEFAKISAEFEIGDVDEIYSEKREDFLRKIDCHYNREFQNWIDNVYSESISNCLKEIEKVKEDRNLVLKYVKRAYLSIDWLCSIKKYDDNEKIEIIKKLKDDLREIFLQEEKEYSNEILAKSDTVEYLKIRKLILDDFEKFMQFDFEQLKGKLTTKDINKISILRNGLNTTRKTLLLDEIKLIDSAIKILNLKNTNEQYEFINDIENDFSVYLAENKKINDEDKINIVKKRISIKQNPLFYQEKLKSI